MNEERSSKLLVFVSLSMAIWTASIGGFYYAVTPEGALFFVRIGHLAGSFIGVGLFLFSFVLHNKTEFPSKKVLIILAVTECIFAVSYFATNFFAAQVIIPNPDPLSRVILDPQTAIVHYLYLGTLIGLGVRNLLQREAKAEDAHDKAHTKNIILLISGSAAFILSVLFVTRVLGYPQYYWLTAFSALIWVFALSYSLPRYGVVPLKSFVAQVAALSMAAIAFADIFIGENVVGAAGKAVIFIVFTIFSFFFIKLVASYEHQQERLAEANKRLQDLDLQRSKFVSIASHQLRAPLTAIIGYSSMLLEKSFGELPDKASVAISKVFRASKNLMQTIGDFLDFSTLEMGQLRFSFGEINLFDLVKEVVDEMQANAKTADLSLTFSAPENAPLIIRADRDKIRHVVVNLIDNAIHYTTQGSIAVTLLKGTRGVTLEVQDTGIGMSEETRAKLFGKFARGAEAQQKSAEGVGLGLYLAQEIVKAHGGTIRAESDGPGKGSRMIVNFPLLNAPGKAPAQG